MRFLCADPFSSSIQGISLSWKWPGRYWVSGNVQESGKAVMSVDLALGVFVWPVSQYHRRRACPEFGELAEAAAKAVVM